MSALNGLDQFSGSKRRVSVEVDVAHVLLRVEGGEGYGEALLTPEQARAVGKLLSQEADSTAVGYAD